MSGNGSASRELFIIMRWRIIGAGLTIGRRRVGERSSGLSRFLLHRFCSGGKTSMATAYRKFSTILPTVATATTDFQPHPGLGWLHTTFHQRESRLGRTICEAAWGWSRDW